MKSTGNFAWILPLARTRYLNVLETNFSKNALQGILGTYCIAEYIKIMTKWSKYVKQIYLTNLLSIKLSEGGFEAHSVIQQWTLTAIIRLK